MGWLLFLSTVSGLSDTNYEAAFVFFCHNPDTAGQTLSTSGNAGLRNSPTYRVDRKKKLSAWKLGQWYRYSLFTLEDEMKKCLGKKKNKSLMVTFLQQTAMHITAG